MSLLTDLSLKNSPVKFYDMMSLLTANLYITLNSAPTELCHKIRILGWVLGSDLMSLLTALSSRPDLVWFFDMMSLLTANLHMNFDDYDSDLSGASI